LDKPVIAITMGDPAGIGPEIVVKVLAHGDTYARCLPIVIGDAGVMDRASRAARADLRFREIGDLSEAGFVPPAVDVLRPDGLDVAGAEWGKLDPAMGEAAAQCLRKASEMAMDGQVQGVVSAPLNKEAFHLAGYDYADELVYLADLTGSPDTFIMGVMGDGLWTASIAEHVPFTDIVDAVVKDRILWYVSRMHEMLRGVGVASPRIAVAALNVHGGEGGLFGREEIDEIEPAIQAAQAQGIDARGPIPADTIFVRALAGEFDVVIGMYHDQVNIARKLQPMQKRATLFNGLPFACGTTAHGTAFDIAGRGIADPGSLAAAIKYTVLLASGER
jgi:4-hydroxythreonine-4-phosphate dehydrogenase